MLVGWSKSRELKPGIHINITQEQQTHTHDGMELIKEMKEKHHLKHFVIKLILFRTWYWQWRQPRPIHCCHKLWKVLSHCAEQRSSVCESEIKDELAGSKKDSTRTYNRCLVIVYCQFPRAVSAGCNKCAWCPFLHILVKCPVVCSQHTIQQGVIACFYQLYWRLLPKSLVDIFIALMNKWCTFVKLKPKINCN